LAAPTEASVNTNVSTAAVVTGVCFQNNNRVSQILL
jgi:hypothetical protein